MKKLLIALLCLGMGGCATFSAQKYPTTKNYLPTDPEKITIYKFAPTVSYEAIGEVETEAAPAAKRDSLYGKLKEEAAKMGGDGIIIQEGKEFVGMYNAPGTATTTGSGQIYGNSATYSSNTTYNPGMSMPIMRKRIIGLVIKYKGEAD